MFSDREITGKLMVTNDNFDHNVEDKNRHVNTREKIHGKNSTRENTREKVYVPERLFSFDFAVSA